MRREEVQAPFCHSPSRSRLRALRDRRARSSGKRRLHRGERGARCRRRRNQRQSRGNTKAPGLPGPSCLPSGPRTGRTSGPMLAAEPVEASCNRAADGRSRAPIRAEPLPAAALPAGFIGHIPVPARFPAAFGRANGNPADLPRSMANTPWYRVRWAWGLGTSRRRIGDHDRRGAAQQRDAGAGIGKRAMS